MVSAAIVAAGLSFTCTPVRVWDGDGPIWCAEGPHVRLAGIAARELDDSCRPYHPCPRASGIEARDRLVTLLGGDRGRSRQGHILVAGPRLTCRSFGDGKGDRTAALCAAPGVGDLSCAMVKAEMAAPWPGRMRPKVCDKAPDFLRAR